MSSGDYSESFTNISNTTNWPNNFNGTDCAEWVSVATNATGTLGDGSKITVSSATFTTGTTGGIQRGSTCINFLSTSTTNSVAIDLLLNFSGRTVGSISFDVATVFNSSGNRDSRLKLFYSSNGTTWTEITGTNLPYNARNNVTGSASISISLPSALNNVSTARLRFYEYSLTTGGTPTVTGSQPKISIDNISVTSTATATAPAAPTITSITPGNQQLSVAFTAGSDGGSAITNYKYSTNGGVNWQTRAAGTTASPIVISTLSTDGTTALTNGTSYNIQIRAVNAVGDGTATASTAATPRTTPSAPTITSITPGNQELSVAFTAGSDGGSAITTYKYSTNAGLNWQTRAAGTTASPLVISTLSTDGTTALSNGVSYDIQIRAVNSAGDGTATGTTQGTPTAPVSPTLNAVTLASSLSTTYGTASTGVGFTASGTSLTSNITATAQTGYQVSIDNSSFGASVSIASGTTVYVRFTSTIFAGNYNNATAVVLSGGSATSSANITTSSSGNTVAQKTLTVSGLTPQNKVYDGSTIATTAGSASLSGVVGADDVTVTGTPTFSYSSANVGTGISVSTIGYLLTGANSGNYTLTQPTFSSDITAANLTITANNVNKNSGVALSGGPGSTAFTSTGLQNGETIGSITITYGSAGSATGDGNTVGVYSSQVTPSLATGGTFTASNYLINYVAGSITVVAAPVAIAIQDFETVPATPTLGYQSNAAGSLILGASGTGDRPASSNYFISSNTAWNANNTSSILTFSNVTGLGSYISKYYEFRLASYSNASTGNGADATDIATVEVSLDGGTNWSSELRVLGNANAYWNYSATGLASITYDGDNTPSNFQPAGGGSRTSDGYSTVKINLSDLSTQARLRITLLNNATGERWVIDDVKLMGTINTSPNIIISQTSLTGFSQNSFTPSSEQSYTVSGDNLTGDVTITPPTGYEVSTSTSGSFSATNPITLPASGGNLVGEPVTIYVRQSASTLGFISGNITHSSTGANSPNVAVSGTRTGSYYSKATGNLDDINSWGSNTDGTGSSPANFSTDGIIYEIRNRNTATIGANWTVTGTASKVLVGDGTNSTDFTIPSGFSVSGTVDVNNGAELTLENATAPTFGTFATNSTLEYKDIPNTLSTATIYKNLKLTGTGTKTFPGGTTNITGNLILTNTTIDGGSGPFSTILLSGDLIYVGTVTPPADANSITLSTNGTLGGTQTITGAGNTLRWFRIQSTTSNTILLSTSGGSSNLYVGNSSGGGITLLDGSILNMNGNDFTLFNSLGASTAFLLNTTASISTTSSTDLTIERIGNGNLGTLRFTAGSSIIGSLTLNHTGSTNKKLSIENELTIANALNLTSGILEVGVSTLSINGTITRTSGNINASNASSSVVFSGSSAQNIPIATFTGNINNLTLNNNAGLVSNQDLTIATNLNLINGKLDVLGNILTIGTTSNIGTISGTFGSNSYIVAVDNGTQIGKLRRHVNSISNTDYVFPIGDVSNYTPLTYTNVSGTAASGAYLDVHTKGTKIPQLNAAIVDYVNRYWEVTPFGITSPNYNISYTYANGDAVGAQTSLVPVKYSNNMWYKPANTLFTSGVSQGTQNPMAFNSNTLSWSGLTSFSMFSAAGDQASPLPIELVSFQANCAGDDKINVTWTTASEHNTSHYIVEHSRNGNDWEQIAMLAAAGNSTSLLDYTYIHENPNAGTNYYRLTQYDNDGAFEQFNPVSVNCDNNSDVTTLSTYPNPSAGSFYVSLYTTEMEGAGVLTITDSRGSVVHTQDVNIQNGNSIFNMENLQVAPGMYYIQITNGSIATDIVKHSLR